MNNLALNGEFAPWQLDSARDEVKRAIQQLDMLLSVPSPAADEAAVDERGIRTIRQARALRGKFFNERLFADPAWDMLLDLYEAELGQRNIAISSLGLDAGVPPTTALRWMNILLEEGLIERRDDPLDGRRVFVKLSKAGLEAMQNYFAAAASRLRPHLVSAS